MKLKNSILAAVLAFAFAANAFPDTKTVSPKREFRGAWMQTIAMNMFASMDETTMKAYFCGVLDTLQQAGFNVFIFQVRPQADAWYRSSMEPWSSFITGTQGKNPGWDPLAFLVQECHHRNIDIHAWINPYRVRLTSSSEDMNDPFVRKHTDWIIKYGKSLWFDPGNPDCREHIVKVVREIVRNYDIDGLHIDDYFYPYPIAGQTFMDRNSYLEYNGSGLGLNDWRRENVNRLIEELHAAIHELKPWVQFGVSPFGIHRNDKEDPDGSHTAGLSNYNDLYADALTWMREGWVDYCIPQLYWEIGHAKADYRELADWWPLHSYGTPMYFGQEVARSMAPVASNIPQRERKALSGEQLSAKIDIQREKEGVTGSCMFSVYKLLENPKALDILRTRFYNEPALNPSFSPDTVLNTPPAVSNLHVESDSRYGKCFEWKVPKTKEALSKPSYYVIYRFKKEEELNLDDPHHIMAITKTCIYPLPAQHPSKGDWVYVVTAVNRLHQESEGTRITLRIK